MAQLQLTALNILALSQTTSKNITWKHIAHTLRLSQSIRQSPIYMEVSNKLFYHHVTTVNRALYLLAAGNVLTFNQFLVPRDILQVAWSPIIIFQEVKVEPTKGPNDNFALQQHVSYELVKNNLKDNITFSHDVKVELEIAPQIESELVFKQGVSVYIPNKLFIAS